MTAHPYDDIALGRLELALYLQSLSDDVLNACIEDVKNHVGGTLVGPDDATLGLWGPMEHCLSMINVMGYGDSRLLAARDWHKRVIKMAERDSEALAGVAA